MRVRIRHTTTFNYDGPATASFNELRLTPRNAEFQNVISFNLVLNPRARTVRYRDHFGTVVHAFNIWEPHDSLTITGESTVVTYPRRAVPVPEAGVLQELDNPAVRDEFAEWLHPSPLASGGDHLVDYAHRLRRTVRPPDVLGLVRGVASDVHERFTYASGESFVSSTVDDLLERKSGVCQDFAHLAIATLRDLGVPARYVSGYFFANPDPEPDVPIDVESHAWVEAWLPEFGWVEVDPTNDCLADERHVVVAVGRDYGDVAPVRGVHHGSGGSLEVSVTMVAPSTPVVDLPRPATWRTAVAQQQQQQQQQ